MMCQRGEQLCSEAGIKKPDRENRKRAGNDRCSDPHEGCRPEPVDRRKNVACRDGEGDEITLADKLSKTHRRLDRENCGNEKCCEVCAESPVSGVPTKR